MSFVQPLILTLLLAPPPANPDTASQGYAETLAEVQSLDAKINAGEPVRAELTDALTELTRYAPQLADDPDARAARTHAQLNLARSHLANGDRDKATAVLDEVIRSTVGEQVDVSAFGPSLAQLYAERLTAQQAAGTGGIAVDCKVPCRIYVNEAATEQTIDGLYLGLYRVWIDPVDPDLADQRVTEKINLDEPDEVANLTFAPIPKPIAKPKPAPPPPPKRIIARPPEVAMMIIGVAAATGGALLIGLGGLDNPTRLGIGSTLLVLGGGTFLAGTVTLGIDEVRLGKYRGRQAMLTWTMAF